MGELFELATLVFPLLSSAQVAQAVQDWVSMPEAEGQAIGCWRTEIGPLGRLLVLRRFDDGLALANERRRALMSSSPFNSGSLISALEMDSYVRFPFLPPMTADRDDAVYEFRTYRLKPGGLPATLSGWESAIRHRWATSSEFAINQRTGAPIAD
jgi:hypothetical protein